MKRKTFANKLHQFWFDMTVAGMQSDLHDREYTNSYSKHIEEAVLEDHKRSHRTARAFDPSIPEFDSRIFQRALNQALETLSTAEEHFARVAAVAADEPSEPN